jgi:site-specific DNA-methyltransferase (adenine-specific)
VTVEIIHGDCLDVLRGLPDASVDAVVTDPPYFLPAEHYSTRRGFPRSLSDLSMLEHFYRDWFAEAARVVKPTGVFYVFCDAQSYPVFFTLGYRHFRRQALLVWDKAVAFNGWSWRHQHELILFGEMPQAPAVKTGDGDILRCRAVKVDDRDHPAEKPVELIRRLIGKSVPSGGVVLDSFAGSGTTGVAALLEGHRAILIEREAAYVEIARRRVAEAQQQPALFVAD